jgi:hypothetical protein
MRSRRSATIGRVATALVLPAAGGLALGGCAAPLESAGKTDRIQLVSSATINGYAFELYRNTRYPCSISGYQTFVIGTKLGSSATATQPLWVRMRGGGVGFFDSQGRPQPTAGQKTEESLTSLANTVRPVGLNARVRTDPAGFRLLSVSMCNHDIYSGGDQPDPNNPNRQPDGSGRSTNGLFATKAAIQFATAKLPTSKTLLYGTSAGSFGAFSVAYSLERQGVPLAGAVGDSGVLNIEWQEASAAQNVCSDVRPQPVIEAVGARLHPELTNRNNQPDKLVGRGALTVPLMHVWSRGDNNQCGETPMSCPMRDGTTRTLGSVDCLHEPLRAAIAAQGSSTRSRNLRLCVIAADGTPGSCGRHTPTSDDQTNTDPAEAADYNGTIMTWVRARVGDP